MEGHGQWIARARPDQLGSSLRELNVELFAEAGETDLQGLAITPELDHVDAGLATLVPRNVLLRHAEPLGELYLRNPPLDSACLEPLKQPRVVGRKPGLPHPAEANPLYMYTNSVYSGAGVAVLPSSPGGKSMRWDTIAPLGLILLAGCASTGTVSEPDHQAAVSAVPRIVPAEPHDRPMTFGEWADRYYPQYAGQRVPKSLAQSLRADYSTYLATWQAASETQRNEIALERERLALERERIETERLRRSAASESAAQP